MQTPPDNILIIGANSAIAEKAALLLAKPKSNFFLVARQKKKLEILIKDLKKAGVEKITTEILDLNDFSKHDSLLDNAWNVLGKIDLLLIAHGSLADQKKCENSFDAAKKEIETNFLSHVSLLTSAAKRFEKQQYGCITVITSIAGDRGRQSNYVYGAAKGALSIFTGGLRNRLHNKGIHVLTVKPGFINTPMTAHLPQNFLYTEPRKAAQGIIKAIIRRRDIVYIPGYWRFIMLIIKITPEFIFKRLTM